MHALARLPNGDLVAGGEFLVAEGVFANHIARWDGTTWHSLGGGTDGPVLSLAVLPNGHLVAAGAFTSAGGAPAANVASWDGATWSALGAGLDATASALLVLANGDLIVGGAFTTAGSAPASRVARWSGGVWTPVGGGVPLSVRALTQLTNGDLVAASDGSGTSGNVHRWNGVAWSALSTIGFLPSPIQVPTALLAMPDGTFFMGGQPWPLIGSRGLLRWNGTSFVAESLLTTRALARDPVSGAVFAVGGAFSIRRFNGLAWTFVGPPRVSAAQSVLVLPNGDPVVGAVVFDPVEPRAVERLTGAAWTTLGGPVPPRVLAMTSYGNGDTVVGGRFTSLESVPAANIARWNGQSWSALGSGVAGDVSALAAAANGDLIVGGSFQSAGGVPANRIARWNGSAWSSIGAGLAGDVGALATRSNGDILAATIHGAIERWDGSAWTQLVAPAAGQVPRALATLANDDVAVVSGAFTAIWNGTTFTPLPQPPGGISSLLCRRNGDLLAGMLFGTTDAVVRRTGAAWVPFGAGLPGQALALTELPNGDVVAGGVFNALALPTPRFVVRGDGTQWTTVDGDVDEGVTALVANERGELMVSGRFVRAGTHVAAAFARRIVPCPAAATASGAGCASVAGPVTLTAENLPWTGVKFVGRATGMAPLSLAVHVLGTNPTVLPLPLGAPGCSLYVDPLAALLLVPGGGTVLAPLAIPNSTALGGAQVRSQVVGLELDANLNLVRTTGTNALLLTIGAL